MEMNSPVVLFGAGIMGKKALSYFGYRNVHCFADNDPQKKFFAGKKVLSLQELKDVYSKETIVVTSAHQNYLSIRAALLAAGMDDVLFFGDILTPEQFDPDPALLQFKNSHLGERCFIIGNGPSLQIEDLNRMAKANCFSFASNRIDKIYGETQWRPNVLCASDNRVIENYLDVMAQQKIPNILILNPNYTKLGDIGHQYASYSHLHFYECILRPYLNGQLHQFSNNPAQSTFSGGSVTYIMLQWAAFMGFKQIYLVGVDHSYSDPSGEDKNKTDYFCKDYRNNGLPFNAPTSEVMRFVTCAYNAAEIYSRTHGFRIYNATRGGKLEVFERVNLDSLF